MRRLFTIAAVVLAAGSVIFARSGMQAPGQEPEPEKKLIDLKSDNMGPIAPGDSVIFLVGNFAAQHNGAVITCDSAVRYSDMRIEFFGNVLINKNTTYIYGDRAEYNGELNEARVYSDIVKVVDGDATLYTYRFVFNTKENIGQFADGGVLINRDNRLESVRGYYYANTKDLVCVDRVEMRNDEYELKGDSVVYNMATDNAFFFENTNIWNKDGDYLYADRGAYDKADTLYRVTRNGYVLTEKQEMWSDSIDYFRAKDHVVLWRDIQIDDTEHKVLAFGDYGEYWKEPGDIFLTRRPSVVSYDLTQGDSLFMRADSMFLFTVNENARRRAEEKAAADSLARMGADSLQRPDSLLSDTTAMALPADSVDSLALPRDSIYRLMKGYRDVRIFRSDFQTVCDSIVAISTDSTIHLYIDPVLWNQSNQITSDVMDIFTERQQIKRAEFTGSPMMASQLDTTHYNQVAGKTMTAYFYNNQIYRNDVNGNAQTIYYMQDGEPPEITMMGVIESGDCSFYIEDKQVVQITYRTEPVYNFYPMDDIPPTQDLYLKGFKWEGARRPVQADVFDRRIRPSQRKERTRLRHPDFPILMRIEEHKKRLIEQRRWADRNDQVDPLTVEWMRELGYEVGQPREPQRPAPQAE